jgi:hypothetical protein
MIFSHPSLRNLSPEEQRIIRAHGQWAERFALFWIIVTVAIFGGMFLMLDTLGAADNVRTPSLVLLATITIVNAIWRAAGVLAARIELMLMTKRDHHSC